MLLYSSSHVRHTTPRSMEWTHETSVLSLHCSVPLICTVQSLIGTNPGPNLLTDFVPAYKSQILDNGLKVSMRFRNPRAASF